MKWFTPCDSELLSISIADSSEIFFSSNVTSVFWLVLSSSTLQAMMLDSGEGYCKAFVIRCAKYIWGSAILIYKIIRNKYLKIIYDTSNISGNEIIEGFEHVLLSYFS